MAGFPGLQAVCNHVLENTLAHADAGGRRARRADRVPARLAAADRLLPASHAPTRPPRPGLVDHLVKAPYPLEEEQALKVMHMLGAMPQQVQPPAPDASRMRAGAGDAARTWRWSCPATSTRSCSKASSRRRRTRRATWSTWRATWSRGQGDSSDLIAAKRVAHTLKGSGAIIGLRGLASLGHHFEDILEHFERQGGHVAKPAADALLDAAYCLEQMVGYVAGSDEYPQQAQAVLQHVLDLANRIDRGESLEAPVSRAAAAARGPRPAPAPHRRRGRAGRRCHRVADRGAARQRRAGRRTVPRFRRGVGAQRGDGSAHQGAGRALARAAGAEPARAEAPVRAGDPGGRARADA